MTQNMIWNWCTLPNAMVQLSLWMRYSIGSTSSTPACLGLRVAENHRPWMIAGHGVTEGAILRRGVTFPLYLARTARHRDVSGYALFRILASR
jgi:hypothetical protein